VNNGRGETLVKRGSGQQSGKNFGGRHSKNISCLFSSLGSPNSTTADTGVLKNMGVLLATRRERRLRLAVYD
jgi:hypothetical protein